jgi:hypothetical protein
MAPQPFIDPLEQETRELGKQARDAGKIYDKTKNATKYLFSEFGTGFFGFGGERDTMNAINNTIKAAASSGDKNQMAQALEFGEIIARFGTDDKAGRPYDDANTFNELAKFSGDMLGMLGALRSLIERIDKTKVNVFQGD